jgi:divalent metal cation (Fe/Co/Zn/Cd) transporter
VSRAQRAALHVSYAAVAWGVITGTLSVVIGLRAVSTALIGSGAGILADVLSSAVLIHRFRAELAGHHASDRLEVRAQFVASGALLVIAVGIAVTAVVRLVTGGRVEVSAAAVAVAAASALVLPAFAVRKFRLAATVPSPALRMDGYISMVGATTGALSLLGLLLSAAFGISDADQGAALAIAVLAAATASRGLTAARSASGGR